MKNLLTQDPPDYGLWTRDKSFFFQTIPIVLADWADEPHKLWVFMVLSNVHLANLFCHCESLVYDFKSTNHFSTKR